MQSSTLNLISISPRHAKRTTISMDDVKLYCRRNPSLLEQIQKQADKIKSDKESEEVKPKTKGRKKKIVTVIDDTDD